MRIVMRIFAAGMLVGWLSGGLAYADGAVGAQFEVTANLKAVAPGGTVTVEVRLKNVVNFGALQFMMKATGGDQGKFTVENINRDKTRLDSVVGTAQNFSAYDSTQGRYGVVLVSGGRDVVDSAYVATVTFRVSDDAAGSFKVNIEEGQETFLRDSSAVEILVAIGKDVTISVIDRVEPSSRDKRKRTNR